MMRGTLKASMSEKEVDDIVCDSEPLYRSLELVEARPPSLT